MENGSCHLISRNQREFRGFKPLCADVALRVKVRNAIIDGEICCLGKDGRSRFNLLLFRKGVPYFYAFDLLWLNGRDLRLWPLLKRKEKLKRVLPDPPCPILYTSHLDGQGINLFKVACEYDLEGIVAKRKDAPYKCDERSADWIKIKNPNLCRAQHKAGYADRLIMLHPRAPSQHPGPSAQ